MTKEEIRAKYARVPTDFSEIEMLKDQLLDSGLLEAAQVSPDDAGKVLGVKEDGTIGVVEGGGGDIAALATPITYSELKNLRDVGGLVPGMQYRITDYQFTTTVFNTSSGNHRFDIIVIADSEIQLNKKARAIQHEGDEYFTESNLAAWQLWYDLDNDSDKYNWADAENGKGVIYRMIDEFNNDIPYDFKNLIYEYHMGFVYNQWGSDFTFSRDSSLDSGSYYGWRCDTTPPAWNKPYCYTTVETPDTTMTLYSDTNGSTMSFGGTIKSVNLTESAKYTFNGWKSGGEGQTVRYEASLNNVEGTQVTDNIMKNFYGGSHKIKIPWNVFNSGIGNIPSSLVAHHNVFGEDCHDNVSLNNSFAGNIFGSLCSSNEFNDGAYHNVFLDNCYQNKFLSHCEYNTCGYKFTNNEFKEASYNVFGKYFQFNKCGDSFFHNIFEDNCQNNVFGNNCEHINFKSSCSYNILGDQCRDISFGSSCSRNIFGTASDAIISYVFFVKLEDGCSYLNIFSTDTDASSNNILRYVHIHLAVTGLEGSRKNIEVPDRNLAYETSFKATGSNDINV